MPTIPNPPYPVQDAYQLSQYTQYVSQYLNDPKNHPLPPPPAGYRILTDSNGQPLISQSSQLSDGFAAIAFQNTTTRKVVIAYEGSLLPPPGYFAASGAADAKIATGGSPQAFADAQKFATQVAIQANMQRISNQDIYVTGHSEGGGEVQSVLTTVGSNFGGGVTFGAPGLPGYNPSTYNGATPPPNLNILDYGDTVGNFATDTPVGSALNAQGNFNNQYHVGSTQYVGDPANEDALVNGMQGAAQTYNDNVNAGSTQATATLLAAFLGGSFWSIISGFNQHLLNQYGDNLGYGSQILIYPQNNYQSPEELLLDLDETLGSAGLSDLRAATVSNGGSEIDTPDFDISISNSTITVVQNKAISEDGVVSNATGTTTFGFDSITQNLTSVVSSIAGAYTLDISFDPASGNPLDALIDYAAGNSQVDQFAGLPNGVSEIVRDFTGTNGTGVLATELVDLGVGLGSIVAHFAGTIPSSDSAVIDFYSGINGSGTFTKDWIDYKSGGSEEDDFIGLPAGDTEEKRYFTGANASGANPEDIFDQQGGGSLVEKFNPSAGVAEEDSDYAGQDGGGTLLSNLYDLASGTSVKQLLSGLPSGEQMQFDVYSGWNATGTNTLELDDYTNNSSRETLYSGLPAGYTEVILNYSGPNATGADTSNDLELSNGTSQEEVFTGLKPGVTQELLEFSGRFLSGTNTDDIYDLPSGISYKQLLSNVPAGDTQDTLYYAGLNGTGRELASVEDLNSGGSRVTAFNPASGISEEVFNYAGADAQGKDTNNTFYYTNGVIGQESFVNLPSSVSEEDTYTQNGREIYETVDQVYGSKSVSVTTAFIYNSSGQLVEEDEKAYAFGGLAGFANYNLQNNSVAYETINGQISILDPGYDVQTGRWSNNNMISLDDLSYLGCGGTSLDSDGDYDNDPLLISTDRQGVNLLPPGNVLFDFSGSGEKAPTGWMGANTGMLLLDTDAKGTLGHGTSVIAGFDALTALDADRDGVIDAHDPVFAQIQVWGDDNDNGTINPGELHSLASLAIASISVASTPASADVNGNKISAVGSLTFTDGTTEPVLDVTFGSPPAVISTGVAAFAGSSVAGSSAAAGSPDLALLGQYMAGSLPGSGAGHGGTLVSEAAAAASTAEPQLSHPHA